MTIQEAYNEIGANYSEVIARMNKDERIDKYLRIFTEMNDYNALKIALEEQNYDDAFRYAHNLKGVGINLGLSMFVVASSKMCDLLRGGAPSEDIEPYLSEISKEYNRIIEVVSKLRNKVLIIDDAEFNREILEEILEDEYVVLLAKDGREALDILEKHHREIRIVLLDLIMPNMDGYEVLANMRSKGYIDNMPVLVISSEQSVDVEKKCFGLGVSDFIKKPFDDLIVKRRVKDTIDLFKYRNEMSKKIELQNKVMKEQYILLTKQAKELKRRNEKITDILGTVVESRNLESGEHINRVKAYTGMLARQIMEDYPEYGLTEKTTKIIESASALHDIGKIAISDNILLKPRKLTNEEFEFMKTHTLRGCEIIDQIDGVWDENYKSYSYEICRYHHERYDGKGYPYGLTGEDIPISAQIVAVADVYDALVSERCYKKAIPSERAYEMILNGECGCFSPKIIECFKKIKEQMKSI